MTRSLRAYLLPPLALVFCSAVGLFAQAAGPSAPVPHGTVTLLADVDAIHPNSDFQVAFHFTLEPGWHIYWANPGDSGESPRLIWQLPAGLKSGAIEWPAPKMLPLPGQVMDFGYTGDVALLVPIHAAAPSAGKAADLAVQLKLVVCRDLCVPGSAQLSLRLPVGASGAAQAPAQTAGLFAAARSSLPKPAPAAWKIRAQQSKDEFVLDVATGRTISKAAFFPLDEEEINNAAPQTVESTPQGFRIHLKKDENLSHPVPRLRGVVEISEGAFSVDAPVSASGSKAPPLKAQVIKSSAAKSPAPHAS